MEHITHNNKTFRLFHVSCFMFHEEGFTMIELLVSLAILVVLGAIAIPSLVSLLKTPQLDDTAQEVINILRVAQNKTLASENNSQYGIYFNTATSPDQYILFKGANYASRDTSYDKIYSVGSNVEFSQINTTNASGNANQVVFDRLTGSTANAGNISLDFQDDHSQSKIIYVDNSGVIGFLAPSPAADTRVKDSRHVDFTYSRTITTASENLVLVFNGTTTETIPLSNFLINGQFDWTGTFAINNANQTIRIHTLKLNSADTQFSIFRDTRLNSVSLTVSLSGDNTGTLVEYSADGRTTNFHSIYVNGFAWQ